MADRVNHMLIRSDCRHFNGYKPCAPHKKSGVHCENCSEYAPTGPNLLIIKLQAAGEVIRNTPLLERLHKDYPGARIYWLTQYPELIPRAQVHKVLKWGFDASLILESLEFEVVYSLDKDLEACALADKVRAKTKKGFRQHNGAILPYDSDSLRKWEAGAFDDLMKANTRHYVEETFEICGFKYSGEKYALPEFKAPKLDFDGSKPLVALNTGAGDAWKPRKYSATRWAEVARSLLAQGAQPILVGGPQEHELNQKIAAESGAPYLGTFPMLEFIGLLSRMDAIVTSVSFAMHVGVGLGKQIVLLNNTFNRHEFYLFGKGVILEPKLDCLMCYKQDFDSNCPTRDCMDLIPADRVATEALKACGR